MDSKWKKVNKTRPTCQAMKLDYFKLHHQKSKEFIRFGLVGVLATSLNYGIYLLLIIHLSINTSYTIGYILSFALNFLFTAHFTFKTKPSLKKGIGFGISHLINYGLQLSLLNLFIQLHISKSIAPIPVYLIAVPINFLLVRHVFKKDDTKRQPKQTLK